MSIVCPVKSHPDWKSLVNKVGEDEAYFLWNNYEGKVPIEVANNRRKSITELRKEIGIPHQINESNRPNILKKISNYNTKNQTSHSVNFDRVGQSQRLKVNLIVDFTPYSQQSREERAEMRSEEGKVFTESVQSIKEPVKEGVDFVFEQNPELANEVYEVLGFNVIKESEITYTDEDGKPCAKMGLTNTTKGTGWKIVKEFKGEPKHSQGGVDITISNKGVSMRRGGKDIKAKYGLLIPNNN